MKPKKYDYEKLYQKWYKVVWPNFVFYFFLVAALAGAIVIIALDEFYFEEILLIDAIILAGGYVVARISRFFTALAIAQKVTATDALLALRDSNKKVDVDDMPEL